MLSQLRLVLGRFVSMSHETFACAGVTLSLDMPVSTDLVP